MANKNYYVYDAVTEICQRMNDFDPDTGVDFEIWAEGTNFTGRAMDVFYESLNDIISGYAQYVRNVSMGKEPDPIPYEEIDFYGILSRAEVDVPTTPTIDMSSEIDDCFRVLEIYPYPDGTNHTDKVVKEIDPAFFKESGTSANWFEDEEVFYFFSGKNIIFYPANSFSSSAATYNYYVKYLKFSGLGDGSKDTDLLGLFTMKVILDAIRMTVDKLIAEEERSD